MKRHIFLAIAILLSVGLYADEVPDTLLSCSKASALYMHYTPGHLSIKVKNIDGSADNFYYTESSVETDDFSETTVETTDITDVRIVETTANVTVGYTDRRNLPRIYTFTPTDPSNRSVSSFTGRKGSDFGFTVSRSGKTVWDLVSVGLGFGFSTPTGSNLGMNISMGRSLEFTWMEILGVSMTRGAHSLSAGLGIHTQVLETVGSNYFVKNPDRTITMAPFDETQADRHSEFNFFSLQVPVLYKFRFGHKENWRLTFGPVVNFNTGGHIKTSWNEGDNHYTVKTKSIGLRPVTVDAIVGFSWQGIGLYARYAPMQRLKSYTGLKFGTFSTGIIFAF